ncbi:hypothetical protein [Methanobrevibacter sp.]|uniref:hypothetical protein n=1 Tax=Methanobrevibacter sp. TaxID=66852 RepID=UPI00386A94F8
MRYLKDILKISIISMLFLVCLSSVSANDQFENSTDFDLDENMNYGPIYVVGGDCDFIYEDYNFNGPVYVVCGDCDFIDEDYSDLNMEDYYIDGSDLDWDEFEFDDLDDDLDWDECDFDDEDYYWNDFDDIDLDESGDYNYTSDCPIASCCLDDESCNSYLDKYELSLNDLTCDVATVGEVDTNSTDNDTNRAITVNHKDNDSQDNKLFILMLMMLIMVLSII